MNPITHVVVRARNKRQLREPCWTIQFDRGWEGSRFYHRNVIPKLFRDTVKKIKTTTVSYYYAETCIHYHKELEQEQ